jgi:NADH-quinone oxidoreductase subunit I/NAD(P)H-quinone oxidoreductase subunit I
MGSIREYFETIARSVVTLGDGFAVTLSYLFRRPNTIQYPDRSTRPVVAMLPERSRGLIEIDVTCCTGCMLCARACPIDVIEVKVEKHPDLGRMITRSAVDWSKCMFCGLCTEVCETGALRHSHEFEAGMASPLSLVMDFIDEPVPIAKTKKGEPPPERRPLGSIIRARLPGPWDPPPERREKPLPPVAPKAADPAAAEPKDGGTP